MATTPRVRRRAESVSGCRAKGPLFHPDRQSEAPGALLTAAINTSPLRSATQQGNMDANEAVLTTHACVWGGEEGAVAFKRMLSCHHHEPKKNGRETAEKQWYVTDRKCCKKGLVLNNAETFLPVPVCHPWKRDLIGNPTTSREGAEKQEPCDKSGSTGRQPDWNLNL